MTRTTRSRAPRPGFSLIELLVVLAIIAVLLAITGVALQKTTERQRNQSTKDQLVKLQIALDGEYEREVQLRANDKVPDPIVVNYCDNDPNRARAIWTAMNLRRQFPETFAEALGGVQLKDQSGNVLYTLQPLATFAEVQSLSPGTFPNEESGALLYIILAKKSVGGSGAMGSAADDVTQGMQRDVTFTAANGGTKNLKTFADAWGNSVGFRRWDQSTELQAAPYLDTKPNPFNANNKDPLDPRNLVLGWSPDPTGKSAQMKSFLLFNGFNRRATVYSPAKDKVTGTADDIIGYRLRRN